MPNYCDYEMKIVGEKNNVLKAIEYVKADYEYITVSDEEKKYKLKYCNADKHLYRVFEAEVVGDHVCSDGELIENLFEELEDNKYAATIVGYCAWSVHSCMFDGEYTYYGDREKEKYDDFRGTTIPLISKELNLDIEIFSSEPGCEFMEHFLVKQGVIEINVCEEWTETYNEETDEYEYSGGFEWDYNI